MNFKDPRSECEIRSRPSIYTMALPFITRTALGTATPRPDYRTAGSSELSVC